MAARAGSGRCSDSRIGFSSRGAAPTPSGRRDALALAAAGAYVVREISDYGFDLFQALLLAVMIGRLVALLLEFRRAELDWRPPRPLADLLAFAGSRSLEIYALSLLFMQILAYAGPA